MFERIRLLLQGKKKTVIVLCGAFFILAGSTFFLVNNAPTTTPKSEPQTNTTTSPQETNANGKFPVVKVGNWTHTDDALPDGRSYVTYSFKTQFPLSDLNPFAARFGFVDPAELEGTNAFFARSDAFLHFNTASGSYTLYDKNGIATGDPALPIFQNVQSFITNTGINDGTFGAVNTYRKRSHPGIIYFELHRDWATVGAPILNQLGILNIPETLSLSSIAQNTVVSTAKDEDIYGTNNSTDGYKRADDFNTVVIGVDESTQKVLTMRSNIRPFVRQTAPSPIISYQKAVQQLREGKATSIYTAPAGEGVVDWKKVYPSDTVEIQQAEVTQSVVAYLEDIPAQRQESLTPYFIFKGFAQSPSGYRIQFVASVDAVDRTVTPVSLLRTLVVQAWAQAPNSSGLKLGTFSIVTPSVTVAPTNPLIPTPTDIPDMSSECIPPETDLENISDWEGVDVGYYQGRLPLTPESQPAGYYMLANGSDFSEIALTDWINRALEQHEDQNFNTTPGGIRDLIDIVRDIVLNTRNCPIRLTGASPTLFIYGDSSYIIKPQSSVLYADPPLHNGAWTTAGNSHLTVVSHGYRRPYLYYEYQRVAFDRPQEGWVIDKSELHYLVQKISSQLHLTAKETERVEFELMHAASDIDSDTVFVGVIPHEEVAQKLPLSVQPNTTAIRRVHFYVGNTTIDKYKEPTLKPIQREENMLIELGATSQEVMY